MSIATVLVYLPSAKHAGATLASVTKLSGTERSHVVGLHLIPDIPVYGEFAAEVSPEVIERLEKIGTDAANAVKRVFEEHMATHKGSHEWRCFRVSYVSGNDVIAENARLADLVVCPKPDETVQDAWSDFAETVIMRGGRPLLLLPAGPQIAIGSHVVIAWNNTREAARAVFDSLRLIQPGAAVKVVTMISHDRERPAASETGAALVAALSRHGIGASFDVSYASGGETGEAILSRLLDEGCDLLVMGGYGHSRFREMIFGGVSRDILRDTWVPTLMSH